MNKHIIGNARRYYGKPFQLDRVVHATSANKDDLYFDHETKEMDLVEAIAWYEEHDTEVAMFTEVKPAASGGPTKFTSTIESELVFLHEGYKHGGTSRFLNQLRGDIKLVELLSKAKVEPVRFQATDWYAHHEVRRALEQFIFWHKDEWQVDVTFIYAPDQYNEKRLFVDDEDPFCTEYDYKGPECALVWPEGGPRYLVSHSPATWYCNTEDPPPPFRWDWDNMSDSEKKEVEANMDHYTYCNSGVWHNWGCSDTNPEHVLIEVKPKEQDNG